jgi:hypothetical protein
MFRQLASALAPDGKLVLAFRPESDDLPARFRDSTYRFRSAADVEAALRRAGLDRVTTDADGSVPHVVFVTASRSSTVE